ncbi:lisH domain-containing protein [Cinnamomum micranthum f. kanehirae]|uniref:LisH domain-containing protein n=1 Tax=Cinnamomum micranthum f. kanehirae TaxID=337451 RepID=A0A3S3N3U0_9MAGN|nr:lisH domain-containing protein [Cinnamomum micranthum f. kanehirae]
MMLKCPQELIPLIMCAIERHPDSNTRDSLTHTLFNLIKRPDEKAETAMLFTSIYLWKKSDAKLYPFSFQACVSLAKNIGEMRTESELLPQCWEQINHQIEERRLLVAQSCGELAEFVRPEIRDSLIFIHCATTDRGFGNSCARGLLLITWRCCFLSSQIWTNISSAVPLFQELKISVDSHLRVLGERERWNIEVLLRMLTELFPFVHRKAIETCPFTSVATSESGKFILSLSMLEMYAGYARFSRTLLFFVGMGIFIVTGRLLENSYSIFYLLLVLFFPPFGALNRGHFEWPAFEWMHMDCFPDLIQLACLLPQKEDNLRTQTTKFSAVCF